MLCLLPTQNHKVKLLNMELTKKEMQLAILALVNYKDIDPELWDHNEELLKELNSLIIKFQTYINGGEKNG